MRKRSPAARAHRLAFLVSGLLAVLALLLLVPSAGGWLAEASAGRAASRAGASTATPRAPARLQPAGEAVPAAVAGGAEQGRPGHGVLLPTRVRVPSLAIDAPVTRLGLTAEGALQVPRNFDDTGWWSGGAVPGDVGPAVVVGHVDSYSGPAVFYRLRDLRPGAAVLVQRSDGSTAVFAVERRMQVAKDNFPTEQVYGSATAPVLRLITCTGTFDRASGHYRDNLVVFARFVGLRKSGSAGS